MAEFTSGPTTYDEHNIGMTATAAIISIRLWRPPAEVVDDVIVYYYRALYHYPFMEPGDFSFEGSVLPFCSAVSLEVP